MAIIPYSRRRRDRFELVRAERAECAVAGSPVSSSPITPGCCGRLRCLVTVAAYSRFISAVVLPSRIGMWQPYD